MKLVLSVLILGSAYSTGVMLGGFDRMRGVPIRPAIQCRAVYSSHSRFEACVAGARAVLRANGQLGTS